MEQRFEQTVGSESTGARSALYIGAWVLLVLLVLGALIAAAGIAGATETGAFRLNWTSLILFALFAALAALVWLKKDGLKLEYDYALEDGTLTVTAILNARRRKQKLHLPLSGVQSCGDADSEEYRCISARPGLRKQKMYLNEAAPRCFFLYIADGAQHMAVLELNPELRNAVRCDRRLLVGSWHEGEGKT